MIASWLDADAKRATTEAIRRIEQRSSVELVVAVRAAARSWPHVSAIAGAAAAWLMLAWMLFNETEYALPLFLVFPVMAGALAAAASSRLPVLVRLCTRERTRRRAAMTAARAEFAERRIYETRHRTGLLVYCAVTEGVAVLVADTGVLAAMPRASLARFEVAITAAVERGGKALAEAITGMGDELASTLTRSGDDRNELSDEPIESAEDAPS